MSSRSFVVKGRILPVRLGGERAFEAFDEMAVKAGRIDSVGAPLGADRSGILDFGNLVITPGLIDAHTHLVFGGNRVNEFERRIQGASYQQIAAEGGGIRSTMKATRAASEDELITLAKRRLGWMLANGTTTLEAKSGYGLTTEDEIKMLRVMRRLNEERKQEIVPTFLGAHAIPPEFERDRTGYAALVCNEMLPRVAEEGLAEFADAFCEDTYFDCATTDRILTRAKQLGMKLRMHADQLSCGGASQLAADLRCKTADHLEQTDENGILALNQAGVQPVLLPASVYALGLHHYPNARQMLNAGMEVVLATDFNPGSSPTPSLPFVMSLACTQMKMTPEEALIACTIHAAKSLDRDNDRGSLEPGKRADFVVWDCEDYREIPYWVGAPLVKEVYIKGERVFKR